MQNKLTTTTKLLPLVLLLSLSVFSLLFSFIAAAQNQPAISGIGSYTTTSDNGLSDDQMSALIRKQLEKDKQIALQHLDEMVRLTLKTSDHSLYQQALKLFNQNKVRQALALLNNDAIKTAFVTAKLTQQQQVDILRLKANLQTVKLDNQSAIKIYQHLANHYLDSLDAQYYAGKYFHHQQHQVKAKKAYNQALLLAKSNSSKKAHILKNLGLLHKGRMEADKALSAYNQAIEIFRHLAKDDEKHLAQIALILKNMGNIYNYTHRLSEAAVAYTEALEIYQQMAINDPQGHQNQSAEIAATLNSYGILLVERKQKEQGLEKLLAAKNIYQDLVKTTPNEFDQLLYELDSTIDWAERQK